MIIGFVLDDMFVSWIEYKQMSVQSCNLFRSDMEVRSVDKVIKPTDEVGDSEISNLTTPRTIPDLDSSILKHVPHRPSRLALETDIFSLENSIESIAIKDNNLKSDEIKPNMTENSIVSSHEDALNSNTDRPSISGSDADGIKYVALRSSNLTTDSGLASSFKSIENIPIQNTVIPEEVVQGNNVFEPVKEVHAIISGEVELTEWPIKSHSVIGSHGRDAAASSDLQLNSSSVNYDSDRRSITSRRSITEEQSEPDGTKLRVKKGSTVRKSINAEDSTSTPTIRRRITSFIKTHFPTSNQQIQQDSEIHDHIPEKSASKSIRGILAGLELKILINSAHDTSNVMSPTIKTSGIQLPEKHSRSQSGYESDCLSPSSASNSHSNIFLRESKVEPAPLSPKPGYSANEISNKHTKSTSTDLVSNTPLSPTMKYQGSPMTSNDFSASPDRDSTEKEEKKSHEWHFPKLSTIKRRESSKKRSSSVSMSKSGSEISLSEKYGPTDLVLGKGAYATVRLVTLNLTKRRLTNVKRTQSGSQLK
ncbi:hypothetical protein HDV02_001259 [Globomyces sp. JEL0801]|nr:hypothetical protein HDV02_001259 [Globomyces sp. JEL0801]